MIVDKDVVDHIPKNPPQCENILPNFLKEGGGLTESRLLKGVCWERGGDLFYEELQFLRKK